MYPITMSKIVTNAWAKGDQQFDSVPNVKEHFAWELLFMGDIVLPGLAKEKVKSLPHKKAGKLLEKHGWVWIELS